MTALTIPLPWVEDDGGRAAAGFKGDAGDCVTRSIAIATRTPYRDVYRLIHDYAKRERRRSAGRSSPRNGVYSPTTRRILADLGCPWTPTMGIGTGTRVHLAVGELPPGRLVVQCSHHVTAVIDGVVRDTHDPTRRGTRAVYGYWTVPT